jgi:tryptophan-rich hypothetical protein
MTRLEGSKWTSLQPRKGWQHFEVREVRGKGAEAVVVLRAVVEPSATVELSVRELLNPALFAPGWKSLPLSQ